MDVVSRVAGFRLQAAKRFLYWKSSSCGLTRSTDAVSDWEVWFRQIFLMEPQLPPFYNSI